MSYLSKQPLNNLFYWSNNFSHKITNYCLTVTMTESLNMTESVIEIINLSVIHYYPYMRIFYAMAIHQVNYEISPFFISLKMIS